MLLAKEPPPSLYSSSRQPLPTASAIKGFKSSHWFPQLIPNLSAYKSQLQPSRAGRQGGLGGQEWVDLRKDLGPRWDPRLIPQFSHITIHWWIKKPSPSPPAAHTGSFVHWSEHTTEVALRHTWFQILAPSACTCRVTLRSSLLRSELNLTRAR